MLAARFMCHIVIVLPPSYDREQESLYPSTTVSGKVCDLVALAQRTGEFGQAKIKGSYRVPRDSQGARAEQSRALLAEARQARDVVRIKTKKKQQSVQHRG